MSFSQLVRCPEHSSVCPPHPSPLGPHKRQHRIRLHGNQQEKKTQKSIRRREESRVGCGCAELLSFADWLLAPREKANNHAANWFATTMRRCCCLVSVYGEERICTAEDVRGRLGGFVFVEANILKLMERSQVEWTCGFNCQILHKERKLESVRLTLPVL